MDILITENINGKALNNLATKYSIEKNIDLWKDPEKLAKAVKEAKAVIVRNQTKINKKVIDSTNSLLVIGRAGVGYDNIDVEYASEKGIVVCYTPNANTNATAELTVGLMISLARKIPSGDKTTKAGSWDRLGHLGVELYNKTLGIVGYGKIGKAVAIRAHSFGMKVLAYDKYYKDNNNGNIAKTTDTLNELLIQSDFISIHLPSNEDTIGLFNHKTFEKIKKGAYLINTSRGGVIIEEDLIHALEDGRINGAALDVREKEPPGNSKLNNFDNVILTPHVGGLTKESQERVINSVTYDIALILSNKPAINFVNFPIPRISETNK